jgi:uncharacterized protein (TIGR02246 family)
MSYLDPGVAAMNVEAERVQAVILSFADAWYRHDMEALAGLFAEDAQFVNVVGLWWRGRDEIRGAHEFTHRTLFRHNRLTVADIDVRFPAADIAIARCHRVLVGHVSPEGEELPERHGILACVVRRDWQQWRIIESQNTDVIEGVLSRPQ